MDLPLLRRRIPFPHPVRLKTAACPAPPIPAKPRPMKRSIMIDDGKRLPWRFHAARAGLFAG